ncbi:MAG: thiamine-phosphate kinase [Candidatus Omnitrophica bacterium]|nr:thiamine-phosphate kinase [Candidatus Omnitrophota bacterium]MCM8806769.1 thiamine-phosphate kinase [Candidatus Omnitrophota bacterium]
MNEKEIVDFLKRNFKKKEAILGIGDDCAVIEYSKNYYFILTTDCLVENVHFERKKYNWYQIGKKAICVNLSDITAMGGKPKFALVSLGLSEPNFKIIEDLTKGIKEMSKKYKFEIIGGNLTKSEVSFVDIFMIGIVEKKYLKTRSGAKVGDFIYVTGFLGASQIRKIYNLKPPLFEIRRLIKKYEITSMIDISDGLSSDLIKLVENNNVGFRIYLEKLPVSSDAKKISKSEIEAIEHALNDGEDYEILFTADKKEKIPEKIGNLKITRIGEIIKEKKYIGVYKDKIMEIKDRGFSHF